MLHDTRVYLGICEKIVGHHGLEIARSEHIHIGIECGTAAKAQVWISDAFSPNLCGTAENLGGIQRTDIELVTKLEFSPCVFLIGIEQIAVFVNVYQPFLHGDFAGTAPH